MNNQTKQQLKSFFNFNNNPQDIGLVIVESKEKMPDEKFWHELDSNIIYHIVDSPESTDKFLNKLIQAQKQNKKIVIELKIDPYPTTINILKEISQFGKINVKNEKGYTNETINIKPGSIIVVAERNFIEKEISYPNFYNLFDSAFSLK